MTRDEKLILLLFLLVVLGWLARFLCNVYVARTYGAVIPVHIEHYSQRAFILLGLLVNFGAGFWIYVEARATGLKAWIWPLLGLGFGVVGIILFYGIRIHVQTVNRI